MCNKAWGAGNGTSRLAARLADMMLLLTSVAIEVLGGHDRLNRDEALLRYLETVGLDFASQLEELFRATPGTLRR